MREPIDPRHSETRAVLRVVGPGIALVGLLFIVIGIGSFFASFGSFRPPQYFWCAFVGMPLLAVGVAISMFAFMGAINRYAAGEVAPVGKDVFNYMAAGTKDSVRELAAAVGEGLRSGGETPGAAAVSCPKCRADNEPDASFCKSCGATLAKKRPCPGCGEQNNVDARFCDHCGKPLA